MGRAISSILSFAALAFNCNIAFGQDYPTKPVRIVTSVAGDGTDFIARQIAQGISGPLGQPIVVDNRPSGVIPIEVVANASADGYTILVAGSAHWVGPLLQTLRYDPVKDFAPVSLAERS